jgi:hypothetical protein
MEEDALGGAAEEAEDAQALVEPALDMSKHKSGIIPILQCVAAAAAPRPCGGPRLNRHFFAQEPGRDGEPGLQAGPEDHHAARAQRGVQPQGARRRPRAHACLGLG